MNLAHVFFCAGPPSIHGEIGDSKNRKGFTCFYTRPNLVKMEISATILII